MEEYDDLESFEPVKNIFEEDINWDQKIKLLFEIYKKCSEES